MKNPTSFIQQNVGWNADPNIPSPKVTVHNTDVVLSFYLNSSVFEGITDGDVGHLTFKHCSRFRLTDMNDEGWYLGQCRFSELAPEWGEFYEVQGDFKEKDEHTLWINVDGQNHNQRNYLFYLRDNSFEFSAESWSIVYPEKP